MKRTAFDERRDHWAVADEQRDLSLMCAAHGCPNRWSVDAGAGLLCGAHAWADPAQWARITERLQWQETERARGVPQTHPEPMTREQKLAVLDDLSRAVRSMRQVRLNPRSWADRLRERHQGGESLTSAQVTAYQSASREVEVE